MKLYNRAQDINTLVMQAEALRETLRNIDAATFADMTTPQECDAMDCLYRALGIADSLIAALRRTVDASINAKPVSATRHFKFVDGTPVQISDEEWDADFREREAAARLMNPEFGGVNWAGAVS